MKKIIILIAIGVYLLTESCAAEKPELLGFKNDLMIIKKPNGKIVYVNRSSNPFMRNLKIVKK